MGTLVATTASALEAMTDRGKFEVLFRAALEVREPRYRALIRTGTNAQGETITAPIDGFARLPGSGAVYALLEATTTDAERLKTKWLIGTKKDKADLVKAAECADQIRKSEPDASFIVILATNQRVDVELLKEVHVFGTARNIVIDPWDNSRIEAVLDNSLEGQSVRQRYLGVHADLLSASLTSQLCETSMQRFASELYEDPDLLPARDVVSRAAATLRAGSSLVLLEGDAGTGKSTIAHHVMREWVATGGFALWATASQVAGNASLESLLSDLLEDLHTRELIDGASTLLGLLGGGRRLLIIVDDLRHAGDPVQVARRLIAWSRPAEGQRTPVVFVAPARPQMIAAVAPDRERAWWTEVVEVGRLTRRETSSFLRERVGVDAYVDEIADRLGDDPFLVGTFVRVVSRGAVSTPTVAEDVLTKLVRNELMAVAGEDLDAAEIEEAVVRLAWLEMEQRRLTFRMAEVATLMTARQQQAIARALRSRLFTQRSDAYGTKHIAFAHDRLQEHFFARAVAGMLKDPPADDVLADPFFARVVGMALASSAGVQTIERIAALAPLAIFEALRFARDGALLAQLREAAMAYLEVHVPHPELERAMLWSLFDADADDLLPIVRRLPESWLQNLVLLRHGDVLGGLAFAATIHTVSTRHPHLEEAIARSSGRYAARLDDDLSAALVAATDDNARRAALILAGHLAFAGLAPSIASCWQQAGARESLIPAMVWAAARCANDKTVAVVLTEPAQQLLRGIVDEDETALSVADDLRLAFRRPPTSAACAFLLEQGHAVGNVRSMIWMLESTGDPLVFEAFVREAATSPSAIWQSGFRDQWTPSRSFGRVPSDTARCLMRTVWRDSDRDAAERKEALQLWALSADARDIALLRSIGPDSELHRTAVRTRARLRDATVAEALVELATSEAFDLRLARFVWSEELCDVTDRWMAAVGAHFAGDEDCRCNECYWLAETVRNAPEADSEALLVKHWSALQMSSRFIQAALVVGTPKTIELADAAIARAAEPTTLFRHVSSSFNLWGEVNERPVTRDHLSHLLRYSAHLDERQLRDIADAAVRLSWRDWLAENFDRIATALPPEDAIATRRAYFPSDDDLRSELHEHAATPYGGHAWRSILDHRGIDPRRALNVAVDASVASPTTAAWNLTIDLIAHVATRSDLDRIRALLPENPAIVEFFDDVAFAVRRRSIAEAR